MGPFGSESMAEELAAMLREGRRAPAYGIAASNVAEGMLHWMAVS